jgi:hypothetical protein
MHWQSFKLSLACNRPNFQHLDQQGEVTIREAVQELRVWSEQTEFEVTSHTTADKRSTTLIKGWKDLFSKVWIPFLALHCLGWAGLA